MRSVCLQWFHLYFWGNLLKLPIFVEQKVAAPKNRVEFCQKSTGKIRYIPISKQYYCSQDKNLSPGLQTWKTWRNENYPGYEKNLDGKKGKGTDSKSFNRKYKILERAKFRTWKTINMEDNQSKKSSSLKTRWQIFNLSARISFTDWNKSYLILASTILNHRRLQP